MIFQPLLPLLFLLQSSPSFATFTFEQLLVEDLSTYNKFDPPPVEKGSSEWLSIAVFLHIESMREISSETTLDFYLIQYWRDSKLRPNTSRPLKYWRDSKLRPNTSRPLKITGGELPESIWYPDTYFSLVRSQIYAQQEQYIILDRNGQVEYNRKVRLTTPCSPDVMLFPFDVVTCTLTLSSFGYSNEEVHYSWHDDGVFIDETNNNVDHLGFYWQGNKLLSYNHTYGNSDYSTLHTVVLLQRKYSAYLMQVYFPAALIVILSWTIFWINVAATPARASLGVTTVLTMLTLATQSTAQNEKHVNRKLTAIDLYLWACFLFVIFAMLEFALSDYTTFRHLDNLGSKRCAKQPTEMAAAVPNGKSESIKSREEQEAVDSAKRRWMSLQSVNRAARVVFPLLFFAFNAIYWLVLFLLASNFSPLKQGSSEDH